MNQVIRAGHACGARPGKNYFYIRNLPIGQLQRVQQSRAGDNRGAVLVIVKNRNIQEFLQFGLNVKTFGRFDIFQVDAAKAGSYRPGDLNDDIRVMGIYFNIEHVNVREGFKQNAFAFHDRFGGQRAAVSKTKDGGAIRDDRYQIAFGGVLIGKQWVFLISKTGYATPGV